MNSNINDICPCNQEINRKNAFYKYKCKQCREPIEHIMHQIIKQGETPNQICNIFHSSHTNPYAFENKMVVWDFTISSMYIDLYKKEGCEHIPNTNCENECKKQYRYNPGCIHSEIKFKIHMCIGNFLLIEYDMVQDEQSFINTFWGAVHFIRNNQYNFQGKSILYLVYRTEGYFNFLLNDPCFISEIENRREIVNIRVGDMQD